MNREPRWGLKTQTYANVSRKRRSSMSCLIAGADREYRAKGFGEGQNLIGIQ